MEGLSSNFILFLILVPTELNKEEARRWAAVLAISGVFAGVVLISLATAAEDIPV